MAVPEHSSRGIRNRDSERNTQLCSEECMNQTETLSTEPIRSEAEVPTPPPTVRRFFFGDDGLRAGWSVLLFILIVAALGFATNFVIGHFHLLPKRDPKVPQPLETPFRPEFISESLNFI